MDKEMDKLQVLINNINNTEKLYPLSKEPIVFEIRNQTLEIFENIFKQLQNLHVNNNNKDLQIKKLQNDIVELQKKKIPYIRYFKNKPYIKYFELS